MTIYQVIFKKRDYVSVETYKEFDYAIEIYNDLVRIWKNNPNSCTFVRERHEREFGYFCEAEFTNGITISIHKDILRELKDRVK